MTDPLSKEAGCYSGGDVHPAEPEGATAGLPPRFEIQFREEELELAYASFRQTVENLLHAAAEFLRCDVAQSHSPQVAWGVRGLVLGCWRAWPSRQRSEFLDAVSEACCATYQRMSKLAVDVARRSERLDGDLARCSIQAVYWRFRSVRHRVLHAREWAQAGRFCSRELFPAFEADFVSRLMEREDTISLHELVLERVARLPKRCQAVLLMRYGIGLAATPRSVGETAAALGLSTCAVSKALKRGHRRLRTLLAGSLDPAASAQRESQPARESGAGLRKVLAEVWSDLYRETRAQGSGAEDANWVSEEERIEAAAEASLCNALSWSF